MPIVVIAGEVEETVSSRDTRGPVRRESRDEMGYGRKQQVKSRDVV